MKVLFSILFIWNCVFSEEKKCVDFVFYTTFDTQKMIRESVIPQYFHVNISTNLNAYADHFIDSSALEKIIFFDILEDNKLQKIPKEKFVCFKWEAIKKPPETYRYYSSVYTFDDDLVDNIKYFKFYYPCLQPMLKEIPSFEEKNFCAIVVGNWIPERLKVISFFENRSKRDLDIFGVCPQYDEKWVNNGMYKGKIPGGVSSLEKLDVIKGYKYSICFENVHNIPGYVSEKIFDCFAAGTVPVYWGPSNIEKYIPSNCYIDYRKFTNLDELYQYLNTISKKEYEEYIQNIATFLNSEEAYLFSLENFQKTLWEAIHR